jgi:Flp pilus assembly protein TadG
MTRNRFPHRQAWWATRRQSDCRSRSQRCGPSGTRFEPERGATFGPERGAIAVAMSLFMIALIAFAGLVIDGGAALAARGRAHDLAAQAARSGADALAPTSLRNGTSPADLRIDPRAAEAAAQAYLRAGQATGTVTVTGQDVSVTAHVPRRTVLLAVFGLHDITGTATATATILPGGPR